MNKTLLAAAALGFLAGEAEARDPSKEVQPMEQVKSVTVPNSGFSRKIGDSVVAKRVWNVLNEPNCVENLSGTTNPLTGETTYGPDKVVNPHLESSDPNCVADTKRSPLVNNPGQLVTYRPSDIEKNNHPFLMEDHMLTWQTSAWFDVEGNSYYGSKKELQEVLTQACSVAGVPSSSCRTWVAQETPSHDAPCQFYYPGSKIVGRTDTGHRDHCDTDRDFGIPPRQKLMILEKNGTLREALPGESALIISWNWEIED